MTKEELIEVMRSEPLRTGAYCDWGWLRQLPANVWYAIAIDQVVPGDAYYDDAAACGIDLEHHMPEFEFARWQAGLKFAEYCERNNVKFVDICRATGINKSLLSHMASRNRFFCAAPSQVESLAHNCMGISAHELLFGDKKALVLPNSVAAAMEAFMKLDAGTRKQLAEFAWQQYSDYLQEIPEEEKSNGHLQSMQRLLADRLSWEAEENRLRPAHVLGRKKTPIQLKAILTLIMDTSKGYDPKLQVYMEAALVQDCPVDYFLCDHFTDYVDVKVSPKAKPIKDKSALKVIDCILLVPRKYKESIITKIWTEYLRDNLNKTK